MFTTSQCSPVKRLIFDQNITSIRRHDSHLLRLTRIIVLSQGYVLFWKSIYFKYGYLGKQQRQTETTGNVSADVHRHLGQWSKTKRILGLDMTEEVIKMIKVIFFPLVCRRQPSRMSAHLVPARKTRS